MGMDLQCPNCDENLGKETENPKRAYCGVCGTDNIPNPYGDDGECDIINKVELYVTENKSPSLEQVNQHNVVRIFVNRDFTYGYFVSETLVLESIGKEHHDAYFADDDFRIEIYRDVANKLIEAGSTPYTKRFV